MLFIKIKIQSVKARYKIIKIEEKLVVKAENKFDLVPIW